MTIMQNAAARASKRLLRDFNEVEQLQVSVKGPGDFVSQADIRAEQSLREDLSKARPGYAFLMEESGASGGDNWDWRWVVDPLDGTSNFLHGIPHWAISIGLEKRAEDGTTEVVAGIVYAPASDEMYWAEKGLGAFVNARRLRVSGRRNIEEAMFATGIPFAITPPNERLMFARTLAGLMPRVAGIRRFGAASLDMAWVAAGRFDGFWELRLKPWDIAAGHRHRSRGGRVCDGAGRRGSARARGCGGGQPASACRTVRGGEGWDDGWAGGLGEPFAVAPQDAGHVFGLVRQRSRSTPNVGLDVRCREQGDAQLPGVVPRGVGDAVRLVRMIVQRIGPRA